jgi:hypothetical protein
MCRWGKGIGWGISMSNYFSAWRLFLIPLGVMSALVMARDGLGFPLTDTINWVLNGYSGLLAQIAVVLVDPWIERLFAQLRQLFSIDLQLYPHWKHVFILLWLYLGANSRIWMNAFANSSDGSWASAFRRMWFDWLLSLALSLTSSIAAGAVPLSHPGIVYWPLAAIALHQGGSMVGPTPKSVLSFYAALVTVCIVAPLLFPDQFQRMPFAQLPSPGLAMLAAVVVFLAVVSLLPSWNDPILSDETLGPIRERWMMHPSTQIGLDVLSVLSGSAIIVLVVQMFAQ